MKSHIVMVSFMYAFFPFSTRFPLLSTRFLSDASVFFLFPTTPHISRLLCACCMEFISSKVPQILIFDPDCPICFELLQGIRTLCACVCVDRQNTKDGVHICENFLFIEIIIKKYRLLG